MRIGWRFDAAALHWLTRRCQIAARALPTDQSLLPKTNEGKYSDWKIISEGTADAGKLQLIDGF